MFRNLLSRSKNLVKLVAFPTATILTIRNFPDFKFKEKIFGYSVALCQDDYPHRILQISAYYAPERGNYYPEKFSEVEYDIKCKVERYIENHPGEKDFKILLGFEYVEILGGGYMFGFGHVTVLLHWDGYAYVTVH